MEEGSSRAGHVGSPLQRGAVRERQQERHLPDDRRDGAEGSMAPDDEDDEGVRLHLQTPHGRRRLVLEGRRRHLRHRREPALLPVVAKQLGTGVLRKTVQLDSQAGLPFRGRRLRSEPRGPSQVRQPEGEAVRGRLLGRRRPDRAVSAGPRGESG